jgi:transcriptional regulator with XRE-family HTH domain
MLELSNFLMGMGDYKQALAVCKKGNDDISITRTKGRYAPDFTYNKARSLYHLKQTNDLPLLLESAFHGYIMLRNPQKAREVKTYAQSISIEFNLFDVNELPNRIPDGDIDWGKPIPCTHFGEFMNGLRSEAKITLEELCEGLCNKSSYVKKEKSKSMYPEGSVYLLEGLMQRLGRDIDGYFYTLLNDDDFKDKQLRDKIYVLLVAGRCDEVEPLLNDLSTRKQYKEKINLQFIKMCQAELCGISHGFGVRYKQILTEAWHVTKKKLNEDEIEHMRLTRYEIIILNETALYLCNNGEAERGLNIFDSLTKNIKKHCVDETERMKTYLTVLYNYTKYLGINNKRPKALALAKNGLELSVKYKDLWHAPLFMTNIAVNLFKLGEKKKSVPYFAQAYFGSVIMRRPDDQKAICEYAREHLKINFH